MEREDREITYLDLTIKLAEDDISDGLRTPIFSVYRKPIFTGFSINGNSRSQRFRSLLPSVPMRI